MKHTLKSWPPYFDQTSKGLKKFDVRRDDRAFAVGDEVELIEWNPAGGAHMGELGEPTGRRVVRRIIYILGRGDDAVTFGLQPGFVVLGLAP